MHLVGNNQITKDVLSLFRQISAIPRKSKEEQKISSWLQSWARAKGCEFASDSKGNVVIRVPATAGFENLETVIIQGHMDMVCEKTPTSTHNFSKDPIVPIERDGWLTAPDTTLGADNGIALAMALMLCENDFVTHPPLEMLFTVDEETGLTGAGALDPEFVHGRILLNLDSETEGVFTIGCAGGMDAVLRLPVQVERPEKFSSVVSLKVGGLPGGHSGVDIDKYRANAIKLLARGLQKIKNEYSVQLISFSGGSARNAIPRDAQAVLRAAPELFGKITETIADLERELRQEHRSLEPNLSIHLEKSETKIQNIISDDCTETLIRLLRILPNGVQRMSADIQNLVETSCNLGVIELKETIFEIHVSIRSSFMSRMQELYESIAAGGSLAGAEVTSESFYPSWIPDTESKLLEQCVRTYRDTFDQEPEVEVIHAGLECAVIGNKIQNMSMISFGPTICHAHSPDEKILISSIEKTYHFLAQLLKSFCA